LAALHSGHDKQRLSASSLPRDNVFDVESEEVEVVLENPAVFAAVAGAPPHQFPGRGVDHQAPGESAKSCRALAFRSAMKVPKET